MSALPPVPPPPPPVAPGEADPLLPDPAEEAAAQDRGERKLLLRQLALVALIVALVVLRIWLV